MLRNKKAQSMIEYILLVLAVIAVVTTVATGIFRDRVDQHLTDIVDTEIPPYTP